MITTPGHHRRGFTLVEVVIAVALVSVMGLAIISAMIFGIHAKQSRIERNGAMRVAASRIEAQKRTAFQRLFTQTEENIVIDDRGTVETADDILSTVTTRFYLTNGTEVGTVASPVPLNLSMVRVEVVVSWRSPGYRSSKLQTISLSTLMAP